MTIKFQWRLEGYVIRMKQFLYDICRYLRRYDSGKSLAKRKSVPNQNINERYLVNDEILNSKDPCF